MKNITLECGFKVKNVTWSKDVYTIKRLGDDFITAVKTDKKNSILDKINIKCSEITSMKVDHYKETVTIVTPLGVFTIGSWIPNWKAITDEIYDTVLEQLINNGVFINDACCIEEHILECKGEI